MELYNLKWSEKTRFSVTDIEDYNIKGTFDPNSPSDIEFFGYRETLFTVSSVQVEIADGLWVEDLFESAHNFALDNDDRITLIVQNAIDDKQGEL